tara:strand:+ start:244 stop:1137 length:894 start_codon:yes stop_codon:yes gene_type:complete
MAKSNTNNYAKIKSKFGGVTGSIQIHSTPFTQSIADPNSQAFKEYLPGGFLPCNGAIKNANEFYALSQVLGVGTETKFFKPGSIVRDADPDINDLGQFQLPDLGSKVIIPSRSVGDYLNFLADDDETTRVGPSVEVFCNEGTELTCDFLGNFEGNKQFDNYDFKSAPKYAFETTSSTEFLDIENIQGHAHNISNIGILNYTAQHAAGGDGKDQGTSSGNSGSGNFMEISDLSNSFPSEHTHRIDKPSVYNHSFKYQHQSFDIPADGVYSTVNVGTESFKKLDRATTPFIIVLYVIKF